MQQSRTGKAFNFFSLATAGDGWRRLAIMRDRWRSIDRSGFWGAHFLSLRPLFLWRILYWKRGVKPRVLCYSSVDKTGLIIVSHNSRCMSLSTALSVDVDLVKPRFMHFWACFAPPKDGLRGAGPRAPTTFCNNLSRSDKVRRSNRRTKRRPKPSAQAVASAVVKPRAQSPETSLRPVASS